MTTTFTLTGNFADLLGVDLPGSKIVASLGTNLGTVALVDLDANKVYPPKPVRLAVGDDGSFSVTLIATNSTGTNVSDGSLRYIVRAEIPDGRRGKITWDSGYFELTANTDLSDVAESDVAMPVTPLPAPAVIDAATAANVGNTGSQTATALTSRYVSEGAAMVDVTKQAGATFAAKLQAAHDGLAAFGGGTILVPAGSHTLSADVNLTSPVTIRGAGRNATTITVNAPRFVAQTGHVTLEGITFEAASLQWLLKNQTSLSELPRWIIQGCRFNKVGLSLTACGRDLGNGTTEATGTRVGLGTVVRDCEFTGSSAESIFIAGTIGVVVDGCWIHDAGTDATLGEGIKVCHAATGTRIINNLFERTTRDGIDAYNAIGTTIANNVIRSPGVCGIEIKWTSTETFNTRRTIVQGNRVESSGGVAYNLDSPDTIAIGNVSKSATGSGFRFSANADGGATATSHGTFVGNMAIDGLSDGFTGGLATHVTFVGNGAFGNAAIGFNLTGPQSVIGNTATGNGTDYNSSSGQNNVAFWGNNGSTTPYRIANNVPVAGYKADGNLYEILKFTSSGLLRLGSSSAGSPSVDIAVPSGANIQMTGRILPSASATWDFGSSTLLFKNAFFSSYVRVGAVATDSRPTASAAGAGAHMFDTTLGKPIWSDGTNWKDAAGTIV